MASQRCQHSLRTGQNSNSAIPTQRLINAAAQEHKREYTSTTARQDSDPTADQQVCDVGTQERGMTRQGRRDMASQCCQHSLETSRFSSSAAPHGLCSTASKLIRFYQFCIHTAISTVIYHTPNSLMTRSRQ